MRLSFPIPLHVFTHVFSRQPGIGYFQPSKTPFSHQSSCPKPSSAPWQVSPQNPNRTRPFDSQIAWRGTARPRRTRGFRRILPSPISIHALEKRLSRLISKDSAGIDVGERKRRWLCSPEILRSAHHDLRTTLMLSAEPSPAEG